MQQERLPIVNETSRQVLEIIYIKPCQEEFTVKGHQQQAKKKKKSTDIGEWGFVANSQIFQDLLFEVSFETAFLEFQLNGQPATKFDQVSSRPR